MHPKYGWNGTVSRVFPLIALIALGAFFHSTPGSAQCSTLFTISNKLAKIISGLGIMFLFLRLGPPASSPSSAQKNVRNPNHHYFSKKYRAIHLPFVLQYASNLYCSTFGARRKVRKEKYFSTPPIFCIAVRLPFVSQYASHLYRNAFGKILVVVVTGMFPISAPEDYTSNWAQPFLESSAIFSQGFDRKRKRGQT